MTAALKRRLAAMEQQQADQVDTILACLCERMVAQGEDFSDDPRMAGYQPPENYDQMTTGEQTLDALRWKYRNE